MAQTIVALYEELGAAHQAVTALTSAGFGRKQINLIAPDPDDEYAEVLDEISSDSDGLRAEAADGALAGGVIGGLAGLLFGLATFSIPGLGPILAAGPLYTTALGAAGGGLGGGILSALVKAGIPEEEAVFYAEGVRRGKTMVGITAEDEVEAARAAELLAAHEPLELAQRAQAWKRDGWEYPDDVPDRFIPASDDKSDQHKYAMGAMGEDLYGRRAGRDRPPLPTWDEEDGE